MFQKSDPLFLKPSSSERLKSLSNTSAELIAITCLLISTKIHEIDLTCLRIYELEKEFRYKYTFKNITTCEHRILEEINWNAYVQTPLDFVNLYITGGILFEDDTYTVRGQEYGCKDTEGDRQGIEVVEGIYESVKKL